MNVGGITLNYPMEYGMKRTQQTTPDECFAGRTERMNSGQFSRRYGDGFGVYK